MKQVRCNIFALRTTEAAGEDAKFLQGSDMELRQLNPLRAGQQGGYEEQIYVKLVLETISTSLPQFGVYSHFSVVSDLQKKGCLARMQGLSSRAHAFSVEALVGKPCKRMKVSDGHDSSSTASIFSRDTEGNGLSKCAATQAKKAGSTLRKQEDRSCDPQTQSINLDSQEAAEAKRDDNRPVESGCSPGAEVRVELQGSELWKRFYEIGTEMIITKAGRRMFPSVRIKVRNLDPCRQYYVAMDVMPVDSKRYRYVYHSSQWMVAGNTDHSCISPRLYVHPDSPCAGETWMRQVISFDRVKLTNNEMDDKGHIILQSMHKYKPRVHIIQHDPRMDIPQIQSLPAEGVHSFIFPETEFTTVTAYQNQQITKLKIDRNPFAKGFRDPGRNRGVLDGLLESYPWRGPLSLDFKPFAIQLQGNSGTPTGSASHLKSLLPLSSSSSLQPFSLSALSCQDATLHTLAFPLFKSSTSPTSPLSNRTYSSLGADRLRGLAPLSPLTDLSLLSALQGKKPPHCRDPCLQGSLGSTTCLIPFHNPFSPQGPGSPLIPRLSETNSPYCLYRYSFPLNPQLTAISRHAKLAEDTPDCLLRQSPWHSTTNHCL
ncbi:T-box transcription factor TBX22 [Thalassophryne amazonica]|uniref:T-box transcription factor TBX22 n=1 Tax=Thalassophryne amazonica TaxID=390379 RepID=UPI001470A2DC|nr:T-box transcription factor TBX22 [Thalassophryne amazonica]